MDYKSDRLYAEIHQLFKIWFIPFYAADVKLTTVLQLVKENAASSSFKETPLNVDESWNEVVSSSEREAGLPTRDRSLNRTGPSSRDARSSIASSTLHPQAGTKYYIKSQEDLYQTDQFVNYVLPFGICVTIVTIWHYVSTLLCGISATLLGPLRLEWRDLRMDSLRRTSISTQEPAALDVLSEIDTDIRRDSTLATSNQLFNKRNLTETESEQENAPIKEQIRQQEE